MGPGPVREPGAGKLRRRGADPPRRGGGAGRVRPDHRAGRRAGGPGRGLPAEPDPGGIDLLRTPEAHGRAAHRGGEHLHRHGGEAGRGGGQSRAGPGHGRGEAVPAHPPRCVPQTERKRGAGGPEAPPGSGPRREERLCRAHGNRALLQHRADNERPLRGGRAV